MDRDDERLRRALAAFGGGGDGDGVWALVDAALAAAARDRPAELRARRDGIVERLYAGAACGNCGGRPPPPRDALAAAGLEDEGEEEEEHAAPASPVVEPGAEVAEEPGPESKILAIRDILVLEDPDQPEAELLTLLQTLKDMDVTYKILQETDIGRHVNFLRKHPSAQVRELVKQLIRKWKDIVDHWVRLDQFGLLDPADSIRNATDSADKSQGKSHQSPRVSGFQYSPSPQRHNSSSSERANNGFESTMDVERRASPAPAYHNSRQMNNNHSTTSSVPPKTKRDPKDNLLDLNRLDSARRRLQENYQEAQNAKKQRTIQVMDLNEIPKPTRSRIIRKGR
ncbi:hypothetical protein ACP70R_049616 [Stipagrostis hirtigluma subsp. patula]